MRTVIIIQAGMGASRLPGKVLKDLRGQPMLTHVVERCMHAHSAREVVVATTDQSADDAVADLYRGRSWNVFRGCEHGVQDRHERAARQHRAEAVVRVTADCPLIDPDHIDRVAEILTARPDMVSSRVGPRNEGP